MNKIYEQITRILIEAGKFGNVTPEESKRNPDEPGGPSNITPKGEETMKQAALKIQDEILKRKEEEARRRRGQK